MFAINCGQYNVKCLYVFFYYRLSSIIHDNDTFPLSLHMLPTDMFMIDIITTSLLASGTHDSVQRSTIRSVAK